LSDNGFLKKCVIGESQKLNDNTQAKKSDLKQDSKTNYVLT